MPTPDDMKLEGEASKLNARLDRMEKLIFENKEEIAQDKKRIDELEEMVVIRLNAAVGDIEYLNNQFKSFESVIHLLKGLSERVARIEDAANSQKDKVGVKENWCVREIPPPRALTSLTSTFEVFNESDLVYFCCKDETEAASLRFVLNALADQAVYNDGEA